MKSKTITPSLNKDRLKPDYIDQESAKREDLPTGPLKQGDGERQCSLLIFVPRNRVNPLINDMTGGYGYSHLAVDCGEVDIPNEQHVMKVPAYRSKPGVGHISPIKTFAASKLFVDNWRWQDVPFICVLVSDCNLEFQQ